MEYGWPRILRGKSTGFRYIFLSTDTEKAAHYLGIYGPVVITESDLGVSWFREKEHD